MKKPGVSEAIPFKGELNFSKDADLDHSTNVIWVLPPGKFVSVFKN